MRHSPNTPVHQIVPKASLAVIFIGVLVLLGWLIGSPTLISILPGWVAMKANTALCFVLSGLCLYSISYFDEKNRKLSKLLAVSAALLIMVCSGMTELEYLLGFNFDIDELLFPDVIQIHKDYFPGRMSPITAFNFVCVGSALLLLIANRAAFLTQLLVGCIAFLTVLVMTGTSYGLESLHGGGYYTAVAIHTNLCFAILCIGILGSSGDGGLMKLLNDPGAAGKVVRRLVPTGILVPMAAGWLSALCEHWGLIGPEYGVSIFSISTTVAFVGLVWWSAEYLRRNEERFKTMLDALPQLAWTARPDGFIYWYNQRWFDYTGTTPEQMDGLGWQRVHDPILLPAIMERWKRSISYGEAFEMDFPLRSADSRYRWFLTRVIPLKDSSGKIVRWLGTNTDITQKREAEAEIQRLNTNLEVRIRERTEELAGAQERLQAVLDAATQVAIIAGDQNGTITVFNAGAEQMLGYNSEEMVNRKNLTNLHLEPEVLARGLELTVELGEEIKGIEAVIEKARRGQTDEREWTYVRKDGSHLTVNLMVTLAHNTKGERTGYLGVAVDITARKRAEAFLRASEQRLRLALDAAQIGDWELDIVHQTSRRSSRLDQIFGYAEPSPEWNCRLFLDQVHPDDRERVNKAFQDSLTVGNEWYSECRIVRPDRSLRWIWARGRKFNDLLGSCAHIIGMVGDITERKHTEEIYRVSEERFRQAFLYSAIGFALVELDGAWRTVNPAVVEILGYSEEELLAKNFQDITHPDDLETDLEHVQQLLEGKGTHYQMEKRYIHKSGRVVWALLNVSIVRHSDGAAAYFISQIQDMTLRHEAEEIIRLALEEKDVLLREIHHRVKNNLQVISSILQLQMPFLFDSRDIAIFKECQSRIRTMALVHERLYSTRSLSTINFGEYLDDLATLISKSQNTRGLQVQLIKDYETIELGLDTAIPLGLIANEMISNAYKHAFSGRDKGKVTLSLRKVGQNEIIFALADDGIGLPANLETRKKKSLGMRLIDSLSRQIRATITFKEVDTGGSCIELQLPKEQEK